MNHRDWKSPKWRFLKLHIIRVICLPISFILWLSVCNFLFLDTYEKMSTGLFLTGPMVLIMVDAIVVTFFKGDLFDKKYNESIVYYIQKGWYYLDFIVGIPMLVFIVYDLIKNGFGIPA